MTCLHETQRAYKKYYSISIARHLEIISKYWFKSNYINPPPCAQPRAWFVSRVLERGDLVRHVRKEISRDCQRFHHQNTTAALRLCGLLVQYLALHLSPHDGCQEPSIVQSQFSGLGLNRPRSQERPHTAVKTKKKSGGLYTVGLSRALDRVSHLS